LEKRLKKLLKQIRLNEETISMVLGSIVLVVVGVLVYNYFTSLNKGKVVETGNNTETVVPTPGQVEIVEEDGKQFAKGLPTTYEVKKGDNLWKISENFYTSGYNFVDIVKENNLKNANSIEVGQKLVIPKVEVKKATITVAPKSAAIEGTSYTTVKGDYLWNIAVRAYSDGYAWTKIYDANKDVIGSNPSNLEKGVTLTIPR
jgi:nucleoid-associated protein YgaU